MSLNLMEKKLSDENSFLFGSNASYILDLYLSFLYDSSSVDSVWSKYFSSLDENSKNTFTELSISPSWRSVSRNKFKIDNVKKKINVDKSLDISSENSQRMASNSIKALMLIHSYRVRGHLISNLDPLSLYNKKNNLEFDPKFYGFTKEDYNNSIYLDDVLGLKDANLTKILSIVNQAYCGYIGVEFMHIQDSEQKKWIKDRIERIEIYPEFSGSDQIKILNCITKAEVFEHFLAKKYPGAKRFGLEGAESLIVCIDYIISRCSTLGVNEVVLGMSHRGRLNVLTNILQKLPRAIFSEFQGGESSHAEGVQGSGDVKYHLGASADCEFSGNKVHLSLTANPSHLEAIGPVVVGKVRAKQKIIFDNNRQKVMGLIIHGDAAIAGQGIVMETFSLSDLTGYKTGGTIHLIANNQVGFTTNPVHSRSSAYCSDIAKMIQSPIFHVNGDHPESVVYVSQLAAEFRQKFSHDVIIDLFCYRRHGHNEMDEPSFTQPIMYRKIRSHKTVRKIYSDYLININVLDKKKDIELIDKCNDYYQFEFDMATNYRRKKADWLDGAWLGFKPSNIVSNDIETGVSISVLKKVGNALTSIPKTFSIHNKLNKFIDLRAKMFSSGINFDWSTAEALSFGTLLLDGNYIRLSGQDSTRGTFSQRHSSFIDQMNGRPFFPLSNLGEEYGGSFEVVDSPLSEVGVVGFEYGYSLSDPKSLIVWEAQFGDFANGAQVIVDQFISSAEAKWLRMSGLVMLLPHGYEGQGPEHSSGRLERYLQMCAENNMQVANCTTPSNYFHILRRQLKRTYRKPLIIMTPKSLLRNKSAVSKIEEMGLGTKFMTVLDETNVNIKNSKVDRILLCSGKIYYDLLQERENKNISNVSIIRIEQLYPFPEQELSELLIRNLQAHIVWCQEEPENMGSWTFIDRRLERVLCSIGADYSRPAYIGRKESASTATGWFAQHEREQKEIVHHALKI